MNWDFSNQTVIVTGGTRGIGRGITESFLKANATVIATYVNDEKSAIGFQKDMEAHRDRLEVKKFDVTDYQAVKNFFQYIEDKYASIEILINNSGIRRDQLLCTMPPEDWHQVLNTNLAGAVYMSQQAALSFLKNRYGRIINISSIGGKLGLPGQTNYAASKAGMIGFSLSFSKEVAKKGITVNTVAPGFIDTEMLVGMSEEQKKEYQKLVPMKRFGKVQEVAHAVLFLASRESSYITGATIDIAGGLNGTF